MKFGASLSKKEAATFATGRVYKARVGDAVTFAQTIPDAEGFAQPSDVRIERVVAEAEIDAACASE